MSSEVKNYKCPYCTGPLYFDSDIQKLKCSYCDSVFDPAAFDNGKFKEADSAVDIDEAFPNDETDHMRAYSCPSCGAQLICDDTTAASSCPYCSNPTIIPSELKGRWKPDAVIPFQLKKEDAKTALSEFYKGKPFLPKAFKEQNHIEEVKGVYVPFWLYDAEADVDAVYNATRSRVFSDGRNQITETDHFRLIRRGSVSFTKVPADASTKMPDDFMDAIEPFDYSAIRKFEQGYLAGFYADRYDIDADTNSERVSSRMSNSARNSLRSTANGYQTCTPVKEDVDIQIKKASYTFMPVWMLATRYKGDVYLFAMNGQTGKMVSDDLPLDTAKIILTFLGITVVLMILLFLFYQTQLGGLL